MLREAGSDMLWHAGRRCLLEVLLLLADGRQEGLLREVLLLLGRVELTLRNVVHDLVHISGGEAGLFLYAGHDFLWRPSTESRFLHPVSQLRLLTVRI